MGNIIGGFLALIAIASLLVFALGFIALFSIDSPTDTFECAESFFEFFNCDVDCISIAMGTSLLSLAFSGTIAGFILKNS